jgi:parvulin-like peptidyl-prolyl isomerase
MNQVALGILLLAAALLTACGGGTAPPTASAIASTQAQPTLTATPVEDTPTPTALPAIALVNGEPISLTSYQAELARLQAALSDLTASNSDAPTGAPPGTPSGIPTGTPSGIPTGTELATENGQRALDELVDQTLLAQGAAEAGFSVGDALLQERYSRLVAALGSPQALQDWMAENGYTEESFRQDLSRLIAAAWMRDQVIASVPETTEQVHARQILLNTADEANQALAELRGGKDFADLAATVDPVAKGELGWFPRGYLFDQVLEDAAFSLQAGEYSQVIETPAGFHILQVIERNAQQPLNPDARYVLQERALQTWLAQRRSQSDIQVIPPK